MGQPPQEDMGVYVEEEYGRLVVSAEHPVVCLILQFLSQRLDSFQFRKLPFQGSVVILRKSLQPETFDLQK